MGQPAVPHLLEALTHKKVPVREKAVHVLAQMKVSQSVPAVTEMLKRDEDANIRMTAATALGEIADAPAITALIRNLAEQDAHVQQHIANVLQDIGKPVVVFLLEMPAKGEHLIIPEAIEVLGNIGDPGSVQYLITLLEENEDVSLRLKTAEALLKIGDVRAATMFVMILEHDHHWYLRKLAAEGLGNLRSAEGKNALMKALEDKNPHVRVQAAEALTKLGFPETALLLRELRHANVYVREEAAEALDRLDWRAESENERLSYLAAKREWKSLVFCGASAIEPLLALSKDLNREVRESVEACLKEIYNAITTVVFGHRDT
jgi:HEAT repeat protein